MTIPNEDKYEPGQQTLAVLALTVPRRFALEWRPVDCFLPPSPDPIMNNGKYYCSACGRTNFHAHQGARYSAPFVNFVCWECGGYNVKIRLASP